MAETLARELFLREKLPLSVASAGLYASSGQAASAGARQVMQAMGLSLENHRATLVSTETASAELILTMTEGHLEELLFRYPTVRAMTLGALAKKNADVQDPFGGDFEEYQKCATQIKNYLVAVIKILREARLCKTL